MSLRSFCLPLAALASTLAVTLPASATAYTIADSSRGAVSSTGAASTSNGTSTGNYIVGTGTYAYNDYFVFTLPSLMGTVSAADIQIASGTVSNAPFTFNLLSYTGSSAALASPTASTYTALGSGTLLGTYTFSATQTSGTIDIVLNSAALSAIQSASGGQFILAGTTSSNGYAFGFTSGAALTQLNITTVPTSTPSAVPEPATLWLLGSGALGTSGLLRRRRR